MMTTMSALTSYSIHNRFFSESYRTIDCTVTHNQSQNNPDKMLNIHARATTELLEKETPALIPS